MTAEAHRHLDENALWTWAESEARAGALAAGAVGSLAAWPEASVLPSSEARSEALACPHCSARLNQAVTQLISLRELPGLQTPPDFLAQVQARLQARPSLFAFWKRRIAEWLAPGHGGRLPVGLASAGLLALLLIWVLPRQSEKALAPSLALSAEESKSSSLETDHESKALPAREKEAKRPARNEVSEKKEIISEAPAVPAQLTEPALAAESSDEEGLPQTNKPTVVNAAPRAQESPASPPVSLPAEKIIESRQAGGATSVMAPISKAKAAKGEVEAEGVGQAKDEFIRKRSDSLLTLANRVWQRQGDSLWTLAPLGTRKSLERSLDSLGYAGFYRITVQGDSLRVMLLKVE